MSTFDNFARTADAIRATTKRNEKAAIIASYLEELGDEDLIAASRFLANSLFAASDQRTANIGGSMLFAAIVAASRMGAEQVASLTVTLGDLGDTAEQALQSSSRYDALNPTLSLADISLAVNELADTRGAARKAAIVSQLIARTTPVEAKYVVKLLLKDLRIGLQEGAVEDGIARWSSQPLDSIRWANMLTGDIGETALLARRGELGSVKMRLFHPLKFMLATPAADNGEVARQMPDRFVVEDKFDGIRAQAHVAADDGTNGHGLVVGGNRVALFSRTMDEITRSFPDLLEPLAGLTDPASVPDGGLILDGEIVPVQGDAILGFQVLQARLGRKAPTAQTVASVPVAFIAYDCLYADGRVLIDRPLVHRRVVLEKLPARSPRFRVAVSTMFDDIDSLDAEFDAARARGNEGLMVKDPASTYKPGRRGREWLKIKRALATLDVVVTAVEVGNGKRSKVLSDYTFAVRASETDPTLLNVGKAYSGLTDAEIAEMSAWFEAHTLQQFAHGKVRTVEAQVVIEVAFDLIQPSARHKSGYAMRFPRIVRLRPDKAAEDIDTLERVRELAAESAAKNPGEIDKG